MKNLLILLSFAVTFLFANCSTTTVVYPGEEGYNAGNGDYDDNYEYTQCKRKKKRTSSTRDMKKRERQEKNDSRVGIVGDEDHELYGIASWYGSDFDGKRTASGEIFNSNRVTAAHKTLALGTVVSVRNLENDKELVVRINDRGPYIEDRILDLSEKGAEVLDFKTRGLTQVSLKIVRQGATKTNQKLRNGATYEYYGQGGLDAQAFPLESSWVDQGLLLPSSVPLERKGKLFRVQIGSYSNIANARYVEYSTRKKFNYPVIVQKKRNTYVVKVGAFPSRQDASQFAKRLLNKGYGVFITR